MGLGLVLKPPKSAGGTIAVNPRSGFALVRQTLRLPPPALISLGVPFLDNTEKVSSGTYLSGAAWAVNGGTNGKSVAAKVSKNCECADRGMELNRG